MLPLSLRTFRCYGFLAVSVVIVVYMLFPFYLIQFHVLCLCYFTSHVHQMTPRRLSQRLGHQRCMILLLSYIICGYSIS